MQFFVKRVLAILTIFLSKNLLYCKRHLSNFHEKNVYAEVK